MERRFPFDPFPVGWYVLGRADELAPGQVDSQVFCGKEVVLWRDAAGTAHLHGAFCPHLGAHLGRGGAVDGDTLVCPFHHFRFRGDGTCVSTPYGHAPPKRACLDTWPLVERNGLLIAWWHPHGRAPHFEIPAHDMEGWTPLRTRAWPLRSHPQETNENAVDMGHFAKVHKYRDVEVRQPFTPDGPTFSSAYAMTRASELAGIPVGDVRAEFHARAFGLGYGFVVARVPAHNVETRHYVWATPRDGERITLMIGSQLRFTGGPVPAPLRRLVAGLIEQKVFEEYVGDVRQDWEIWENKVYVHPPALAKGDGPVGPYRQWCRQFYPDAAGAEQAGAAR
jgi:phenylpropionate dioxygenase-like ring-hydroxylating dioxygenase large terminal subunit